MSGCSVAVIASRTLLQNSAVFDSCDMRAEVLIRLRPLLRNLCILHLEAGKRMCDTDDLKFQRSRGSSRRFPLHISYLMHL